MGVLDHGSSSQLRVTGTQFFGFDRYFGGGKKKGNTTASVCPVLVVCLTQKISEWQQETEVEDKISFCRRTRQSCFDFDMFADLKCPLIVYYLFSLPI